MPIKLLIYFWETLFSLGSIRIAGSAAKDIKPDPKNANLNPH